MSFPSRLTLLSSRLLHLILMPTEQCNFRCVYCYEDFSVGQMARPVVDAVKALIARRVSRLEILSIEWFGGEPLLAWPVIQEIQGFACEAIREHPEVRLLGSITTNASLLSRQRFDQLLELGVRRYQISLDGAPESHDALRQRLGGGGTFQTVWHHLLEMHHSPGDFDVLLHLHVTSENLPSVDELLMLLARAIGGDSRFAVMFKPIRCFGGPNDATLPILPPNQENAILNRLVARAIELGLTEKQDVMAQPGLLPGCYAAALGSYVVRATGELAKCTVALAHPNNRIGFLRSDGTVDLESTKMTGWLRGAFNGQPESMACPMQGWADGAPPESVATQLVQIGGIRSSQGNMQN